MRSYKNGWMTLLILILFLAAFPNQILSKTTKTSKTPKASQNVKTTPKTETSQATPAPSGSLQ